MKINGYKIRFVKAFFVDNKIVNWGAIHIREARHYGIKFPFSKNTILVQRGMSLKQKNETFKVLRKELNLMDKKHISYKKAHEMANK